MDKEIAILKATITNKSNIKHTRQLTISGKAFDILELLADVAQELTINGINPETIKCAVAYGIEKANVS